TYTPAPNQFGTDSFTYRANDSLGSSAPATVTLTITGINDEPGFTSGGNVTVSEDRGAYSAAWATGITAGPLEDSSQTVSFTVSNNANALFSTQPALSPTGTLT